MGEISRREFVGAGCAAFVALRATADEKPVWTAGIVTDTHVKRTRESCARFKMACDLFASRNVDLFVNCGDIADHYYPEAYPILREMSDAAFPAKPPRKIWVYANHDWIDRKDEPWEKVFGDVRRLLGGTHDLYDVIDMQGWPLVVLPQFCDFARVEKMLADVCADPRYAGKPVLVFDHVPPRFTTDNSETWGSAPRLDLYSKFPRVVHICGHAHSSLRSELNIWQGAFSVVGMGCLATWAGHAVGRPPSSKDNYGAVILEAFTDRLAFRRFDVRTRREYSPEAPWSIPIPFDPATAPYRRDRAAKSEPVPQFPAGAKLTLSADNPFTALSLTFPRAEGPHGVYRYTVRVTAKGGGHSARCDFFGQFYLREDERDSSLTRLIQASTFEPGTTYTVSVSPCNCFGREGRPLTAQFAAASAIVPAQTTFESRDPMAECRFMTGLTGGKCLTQSDGFYDIGTDAYRLEFPKEAWKGSGRYRFIIDMSTSQNSQRTWTLTLRNQFPKTWNANARIATPEGDSGRLRYVIEFEKKNPDHTCNLLVREGENGRIKFHYVRIERMI